MEEGVPEPRDIQGIPIEDVVYCPRHPEKLIEYFCKTDSESVCVKCIYDDHNGHHLMQVEEMCKF